MTDCIRITKETEAYFKALLPDRSITWVADESDIVIIGGIRDNTAVGVMTLCVIGYQIKIIHIVVSEEFRRKRVATDMIEYICKYAGENGYMVSCDYASREMVSEPIGALFSSIGYFSIEQTEGYECEIPFKDIIDFHEKYGDKRYGYKLENYFKLSKATINKLMIELEAGGNNLYDAESERLIDKLCLASIDKNKDAVSIVLTEYQLEAKNKIKISFAYCNKNHTLALVAALLELSTRLMILQKFLKEIKIDAVNYEAMNLIEKISPNRRITKRYYTCRWNYSFN